MAAGHGGYWTLVRRRSAAGLPTRWRRIITSAVAASLCALSISMTSVAGAQTVRGLVIGHRRVRRASGPGGGGERCGATWPAHSPAPAWTTSLVLEDEAATPRARHRRMAGDDSARRAHGDTLVLTYAGHGGQEPARVPGSERDGLDEMLLLSGFTSSGPGTRERIRDDELNLWFAEAGERGLRVIFVADSCHAGTLTRSIDPRAPAMAVRTAQYTTLRRHAGTGDAGRGGSHPGG